jgi:hypothetical protein
VTIPQPQDDDQTQARLDYNGQWHWEYYRPDNPPPPDPVYDLEDIQPEFRGPAENYQVIQRPDPQQQQPQYQMNYWDDPQRIVRYYNALQTAPGTPSPVWLDQDQLTAAYKYLEIKNAGKPEYEWAPLAENDPLRGMTKDWKLPPVEMMPETEKQQWGSQTNSLVQDQIAASTPAPAPKPTLPDPAGQFGVPQQEWDQLPTWQKILIPVLSWTAPVLSTLDKVPVLNKVMGAMDLPAESVERAIGMAAQVGGSMIAPQWYGDLQTLLNNLPAAWDAAHLTYESTMTQMTGGKVAVLGQAKENQLDANQVGLMAMKEVRDRIAALNSRQSQETVQQIYEDISNRYGFTGMAGEMAGHMLADPLNLVGLGEGIALEKVAGVTGRDLLATTARATRAGLKEMGESGGLIETLRVYGTLLRHEPLEEVAKMGTLERWLARVGIDEAGRAFSKDLVQPLEKMAWYDPRKLPMLFQLTPQARANELLAHTVDNLVHVMEDEQDPEKMIKYVAMLSKAKPAEVAEVAKVLQSVEGGVFPLALRESMPKIDEMFSNLWKLPEKPRTILNNIARTLEMEPADLLKEINQAHGADNFVTLLKQRLKTLVEAGNAGAGDVLATLDNMTGNDLAKLAEPFIKGTWALTADEFKYKLIVKLAEDTDAWAAKWFKVKPDPLMIRLNNAVKNAQSLVLLGLNPTFALNNAINNAVTMAYEGVFGLESAAKQEKFWTEFGMKPMRLAEGVGGMLSENASTLEGAGVAAERAAALAGDFVEGKAIREASVQPGKLEDFSNAAKNVSKKVGFASELSGKMEKMSSEMAMTNGTRKAWFRLHREGIGYDKLPTEMENALKELGIRPEAIYSAINGGMTKDDVFQRVLGAAKETRIDRVATPEEQRVLQEAGVLDHLKEKLATAETPEERAKAFVETTAEIQKHLEEEMDRQAGEWSEKAFARVKGEGLQAAVDQFGEIWDSHRDFWMAHFDNMQDIFSTASKMRSDQRAAYITAALADSDREWSREWSQVNAKLAGALRGLGADSVGDIHAVSAEIGTMMIDNQANWREYFDLRKNLNQLYQAAKGDKRTLDLSAVATLNEQLSRLLGRDIITNGELPEYALINEAMNLRYRVHLAREQETLGNIDARYARLFEKQFGDRAAAEAWRVQANKIRVLQGEAQIYFRSGDGSGLAQMGEDGVRVRAMIDKITKGKPQQAMDATEKAKAWQRFNDEVYKGLIAQQAKANQVNAGVMMEAATGRAPQTTGLAKPVPNVEISKMTHNQIKAKLEAAGEKWSDSQIRLTIKDNPDQILRIIDPDYGRRMSEYDAARTAESRFAAAAANAAPGTPEGLGIRPEEETGAPVAPAAAPAEPAARPAEPATAAEPAVPSVEQLAPEQRAERAAQLAEHAAQERAAADERVARKAANEQSERELLGDLKQLDVETNEKFNALSDDERRLAAQRLIQTTGQKDRGYFNEYMDRNVSRGFTYIGPLESVPSDVRKGEVFKAWQKIAKGEDPGNSKAARWAKDYLIKQVLYGDDEVPGNPARLWAAGHQEEAMKEFLRLQEMAGEAAPDLIDVFPNNPEAQEYYVNWLEKQPFTETENDAQAVADFMRENDQVLVNEEDGRIAQPEDVRPRPTNTAQANEVRSIANEYGVATVDDNGKVMDKHLLNIVRKYTLDGEQYNRIDMIPPEVAREALANRQAAHALGLNTIDPDALEQIAAYRNSEKIKSFVDAQALLSDIERSPRTVEDLVRQIRGAAPNMDEKQVKGLRALVDAHAKYLGITPDEYVRTHINEVRFGGEPATEALYKTLDKTSMEAMQTYIRNSGYGTDTDAYYEKASAFLRKYSGKEVGDSAFHPNDKTLMSIDVSANCPLRKNGTPCIYCYVENPRGEDKVLARIGKRTMMNPNKVYDAAGYVSDSIRLMPQEIVDFFNNEMGGMRVFSVGDFQPEDAVTLDAIFADAEARGLRLKVITKQKETLERYASYNNVRFHLSTDFNPASAENMADAAKATLLKRMHWDGNLVIKETRSFVKSLSQDERKLLAEFAKVPLEEFDRRWGTVDTSLAEGFLNYQWKRHGKPTPEMQALFEKFKDRIAENAVTKLRALMERPDARKMISPGWPIEDAIATKAHYNEIYGEGKVLIRTVAMNKADQIRAIMNHNIDVVTLYHGGVNPEKFLDIWKMSNPNLFENLGTQTTSALASIFQGTKAKSVYYETAAGEIRAGRGFSQKMVDEIFGEGKVTLEDIAQEAKGKLCCAFHGRCALCKVRCGFSAVYDPPKVAMDTALQEQFVKEYEQFLKTGSASSPEMLVKLQEFKRQYHQPVSSGVEIFQKMFEGVPRASIEFDIHSKATIRALKESTNVADLAHEFGHLFRRDMKFDDEMIAAKWAGGEAGHWDVDMEEKFARGFEVYLREGKAPSTELAKVFEDFKQWLLNIYKSLSGEMDIEINPEIRSVFDRLLGSEGQSAAPILQGASPLPDYLLPYLAASKQEALAAAKVIPGNEKLAPNTAVTLVKDGKFIRLPRANEEDIQAARAAGYRPYDDPGIFFKRGPAQPAQPTRLPTQGSSPDEIYGLGEVKTPQPGGLPNPETSLDDMYDMGPAPVQPQQPEPDTIKAPLGEVEKHTPIPLTEAQHQGWTQQVRPMLKSLQDKVLAQKDAGMQGDFIEQVRAGIRRQNPNMPEAEVEAKANQMLKQMRAYLGQVTEQMKGTKLAAMRWGEQQRDMALLNYSRRTNFDNMANMVFPYQFWYTRSVLNWAQRAMDRPAILSNWARLKNFQQNTVDKPGFPTRLRGKMAIPLPFMPAWMGEGIYVDPFRQLFPFENFFQPFDKLAQQDNLQAKKAQSVLQQMVTDEQISAAQAQEAIQTRQGKLWNTAMAQATNEMDSEIANPFDFMTLMTGTSLPIQWGYNLAMNRKDNIGQLPPTRALQAVTGALGIGGPAGVNIEAPFRKMIGLPEGDQFADYRVDRMLAGMAAEGEVNPDDATRAMIDRQGPAFDEAQRRVSQMGAAQYFGGPLSVDFFPEGEQEQRKLQLEYNQMMAKYNSGDTSAYRKFFDDHPEYTSQMMAWKDPQERLRRYLISDIWSAYNAQPDLHKTETRQQLGKVFQDAFLSKETRSYDAIDTQTLTMWAHMLGSKPLQTQPAPAGAQLQLSDDKTTAAVQAYDDARKKLFPDIGNLDSLYYSLPQDQQATFAKQYPQIQQYSKWRTAYLANHPEIIPNVTGQDEQETSNLGSAPAEVQAFVYKYRAAKEKNFPNLDEEQAAYSKITDASQKAAYRKQHPDLQQYWDWRQQIAASNPQAAPYILSEQSLSDAILGGADTNAFMNNYKAQTAAAFPNIDEVQGGYFNIPETDKRGRAAYLKAHPELGAYWTWKRSAAATFPQAADQIMSDQSLSNAIAGQNGQQSVVSASIVNEFSPQLVRQVVGYLYSGEQLTTGAQQELKRHMQSTGYTGSIKDFVDELAPAFGGTN